MPRTEFGKGKRGIGDLDNQYPELVRRGVLNLPKSNWEATTDPGVDDDHSFGYVVGSWWLNTTDGGLWICSDNSDGAAAWSELAVGAGGNHAALSATHTDAVVATLVRGDVLIVNSTPKLDRLAIGAADRVIKSDGTDFAWGIVGHDELSGLADDDHPQYHTPAEHTAIGDSSPHHAAELAASTTVQGVVELATAAETNTGADATKAVTPDGLAGSDFGTRYIQVQIDLDATDNTTGTAKARLHIPPGLDLMELNYLHAEVATAGTGSLLTIDVNKNGTTMLSTKLTVDASETGSDTAATAYVISVAGIATNDVLTIDVDGVHTTPAKGLTVTLGFQVP